MKKLFLAATLAFAGFTAAQASEVKLNKIEVVTTAQDSVTKTPVKLEDLPQGVKTTLQSEPYKVWTATAAFLVKDAKAQKEWYQIDVKKEQETGSIKLDKDGKPVE